LEGVQTARTPGWLEARRSRRAPERVEDRALTRETLPAVLFPSTAAGVVVSERGALAIADAYACVRVLSDTAASLPLHVYRRTNEGRVRAPQAAAARLLDRPAPAVTQSNLVGQLVAHLALHGEAFIALYRDVDGRVAQLGLLPPNLVSVEVTGGVPVYKWADELGRPVAATTDDVCHVKGLTLDGLRGVSPVREAREALGFASALATTGSSLFANGARPSGVLSVPPGPSAEEHLENLRDGWNANHKGPRNAGRTGFLVGDMTFTPVQMSLADAEWLGSREFSTREVARIFRVPAWMIGGGTADSLTYSTVAEQARGC
jgi:HK97 family phage portal protein